MNDLIVKNVDFQGTSLMAIQEKKTGKIFTAINLVLRGLGFDNVQIRYQRDKWNEDKTISKGVLKFSHPSQGGGMQESYCIDIMKLPLALAKINITPKMQTEMPELAERLEVYQDRCADALAKEFNVNGSATKELRPKKTALSSANNSVKIMTKLFLDAGADPAFVAVAARNFIKEATDLDFDVPLISDEENLYDKTTMAEKLGVCSNSGKPHPQYIGAVISRLNIGEEETVNTPYTRHGHSGVDIQYKQSVFDKVQCWLREHDYPEAISPIDGRKTLKAKFLLEVQ